MRLLVTRPELDGERTAARLRAGGCDVLLAPLLVLETVADPDLGERNWGAVAITSANAVLAVAWHLRRPELLPLPVFAVGRRTAEAARAAGFGNITSADGDKDDLIRLIAARCRPDAPLLYLAGEDRAGDLSWELAGAGIRVRTVIVYRARKISEFPQPVCEELASGGLDGVLHFSRRTAASYIECAAIAGLMEQALAPAHYCLSRNVAEALLAVGAPRIHVAPRPKETALLDLVLTTK